MILYRWLWMWMYPQCNSKNFITCTTSTCFPAWSQVIVINVVSPYSSAPCRAPQKGRWHRWGWRTSRSSPSGRFPYPGSCDQRRWWMEVYGIAQILPVARVGEGNQPVEAGGCDVKHVEASARLRIRLYIIYFILNGEILEHSARMILEESSMKVCVVDEITVFWGLLWLCLVRATCIGKVCL